MSYIVVQDGKISLTQEALLVNDFVDLYNDKKKNKNSFMDCIKYIYYYSDKYSPYINYIPSDRISKIKREQLSYLSPSDFEAMINNDIVLRCIDTYKSDNYDLIDRSWDGAKIKVDNFLKHLNNIPMEIEKSIDVEVQTGGGKVKKVRTTITQSNQEEYWKALKTYNEVLKFIKQVQEDTIKDIKDGKRKNIKRRLYDDEESLNIANNGPRMLK